MGMMAGYKCKKCGFHAELGTQQPYFVMSGSRMDKYCPETGRIVHVFRELNAGFPEISCLKDKQREVPESCKNCKGECLKDFEVLVRRGKNVEVYKCPCCGGRLEDSQTELILID
jgi:hypothetical protein